MFDLLIRIGAILIRSILDFNLQELTCCGLLKITLLQAFNGWQLAKMKKSIPDMSLPWNL